MDIATNGEFTFTPKAGDLAAVGCMVESCRECHSCREGEEQYCEKGMILTYGSKGKDGLITYKDAIKEFPDYAALAKPTPVSVEHVQAVLGSDETLVLFLDTPTLKPSPEETFIWVVTRTDVRWVRSELGTRALTREVAALRCRGCGAEHPENQGRGGDADRCAQAFGAHQVLPQGRGDGPA
jgi:hypothetical protein